MYGGRVSDDMDRRILKTYLEEYMGDFLFDDCEKFTFSRTGFEYTIPEWGEVITSAIASHHIRPRTVVCCQPAHPSQRALLLSLPFFSSRTTRRWWSRCR